ncbi:MAG: (Fe-S)-binding protein [Thermoprotei archaeon]
MTLEDALREASKCVHCGFCLEACPTYNVTRNELFSPRGRILAFNTGKNLDVFLSCLYCRRCETVCPSGVNYSAIYVEAIKRVRRFSPTKLVESPKALTVALKVLRKAKPYIPEPREPLHHKDEGAEVVIFPGCLNSVLFRNLVEKAVQYFKSVGVKTEVINGCCGLAHLHSGDEEGAKRSVNELRAKAGNRPIVSLASNCTARLKEEGLEVYDFAEFVVKRGLPVRGKAVKVTVHDSCHASHFGLGKYNREVLKMIGADVVEMEEPNYECGAGGYSFILGEGVSEAVSEVKKGMILKTGLETVVSTNPVCTLNFLRKGLKPVHVLDLIEP